MSTYQLYYTGLAHTSGGELTGPVTFSPPSPLCPPTSIANRKTSVRTRTVVLVLTGGNPTVMLSWCDGADVSAADTAAIAATGLGVSERVTSCVI